LYFFGGEYYSIVLRRNKEMKKIIMFALCAALCLGLGAPSLAVELNPQDAGDVPRSFAVVKDGNLVYGKKPTAFSPAEINTILEAYGFELSPESVTDALPVNFAKASDGTIAFGKKPTAYNGSELHAIFSAYGLTLSPEAAEAAFGGTNFATVRDGQVVFGKKPTAYSGGTLAEILSAYSGPPEVAAEEEVVVIVEREEPVVEPEPEPAPLDTDGDGIPDDSDICPGTPAGAVIDERGCWVLNQDYLFDFDKAEVKPQYYSILDDVVRVIEANPGLRVEIQGHTDSIGTHEYNMGLSQRRANAVRNYMVNQGGIAPARLTTVGYGETRPIATNATKEGRAQNRRVELNPIW
jgi:outer membrane protein OmpA-like peptidoglycan-associated protein